MFARTTVAAGEGPSSAINGSNADATAFGGMRRLDVEEPLSTRNARNGIMPLVKRFNRNAKKN
jgi:hypothetical protein